MVRQVFTQESGQRARDSNDKWLLHQPILIKNKKMNMIKQLTHAVSGHDTPNDGSNHGSSRCLLEERREEKAKRDGGRGERKEVHENKGRVRVGKNFSRVNFNRHENVGCSKHQK